MMTASKRGFIFKLRRYTMDATEADKTGRGSHSSTVRPDVTTFEGLFE